MSDFDVDSLVYPHSQDLYYILYRVHLIDMGTQLILFQTNTA